MLSIEEQLGRIADALFALRDESIAWRTRVFVKKLTQPVNAGTSRNISERKENDMFVEDMLENFDPLPPAVGDDADIAGGVWTVSNGDTLLASTDVNFDLGTRQPITKDFPWSAPKGATVTKRLYYYDDETPANHSKIDEVELVVTDTVPPNAPTSAGTSQNVCEREVPDA